MGNASSVEEIKLGDKIGEGSFGEVFKAVWCGKQVAAKRIHAVFFEGDRDGSMRERFMQRHKSEWELLSSLNHPNIVQYYTMILPPIPKSPIIVTELLECDLQKHIQQSESKPKVPFSDVVKIMLDVAEGLQYLHSLKEPIVHRDLASKNILLTKKLHAKIADLGLAKIFPNGAMFATVVPGTPVYAAPETYPSMTGRGRQSGEAIYREKIDIFSYGAVMLETIIGHLPERALPEPVLEDGEIIPEYIRRSEDLYEMGPDHPLHNLVCQCFENNPEKRPSADKLVDTLRQFCNSKISGGTKVGKVESMPPIHFDHKFKILVLGESDVGKTSILSRFLYPNCPFPDVPAPVTTETEDHFQRLRFRNKSVSLHLVDVGGHKFNPAANCVPQIVRCVQGVVIVFDLTSQLSFLEVSKWLDFVRERCHEQVPVVLVGNKSDEAERWVDSMKVKDLESKKSLFYLEASAKSRENIDEIFSVLMDLMIEQENLLESSPDAANSLLSSLQRTLSKSDVLEKKLIAELHQSPRREFLSPDVIILEEAGSTTAKSGDAQESNTTDKHKCCILI
ncbi:LOW QUALITY PROTEIN: probable serine/threonine-protein kinase PBL1 [Acropora millepora]|uniref:LOW QUALITY PROTEIN: probable serine/threonine-protein kinase PBL1 n=1 Tax=Acropora millepora TaxID=45264 RepID=UPI001CF2F9F2|nr:LOW QUALITY PROTEIN: probable serine/threonine-protein kinase PBL1 [Acropora millepora]